jgi:hypothetical protein
MSINTVHLFVPHKPLDLSDGKIGLRRFELLRETALYIIHKINQAMPDAETLYIVLQAFLTIP